jgi:hypothetical protein
LSKIIKAIGIHALQKERNGNDFDRLVDFLLPWNCIKSALISDSEIMELQCFSSRK